MRALLSAVGTRGDVQPIVALGLRLRELGHDARLCVPPNFVAWARELGFDASPVGVEMRFPAAGAAAKLTPEELRRLRETMPDLITDQFERVAAGAEGCDVILGGNAHQYAARSVAELRGIPYVTALYAPVAIPSADHAPPPLPGQTWEPATAATNLDRWDAQRRAWNERALERVNTNRGRLGLAPIDDVLAYNVTAEPWLAADAALAPIPSTRGIEVFQTGAWLFEDPAPLPQELVDFIAAGVPPVYVGFGSMPAPPDAGPALLAAVRRLGGRVIVARGWGNLASDGAADCISVDEVNHAALFSRVAAAVHHGGAGTTAAAARAGLPQVIVPLFGDQFYWASRVRALGLGVSVGAPFTADALAAALAEALEPAVGARARSVARELDSNGTTTAARRLIALA